LGRGKTGKGGKKQLDFYYQLVNVTINYPGREGGRLGIWLLKVREKVGGHGRRFI